MDADCPAKGVSFARRNTIASAIAFSKGYVGASMHGYITAAAYEVPGIIVGRPKLPKMQGVLAHLSRQQDEVGDWASAICRISQMIGRSGPTIPTSVHSALDEHWQKVKVLLRKGAVPHVAQNALLSHAGNHANAVLPFSPIIGINST